MPDQRKIHEEEIPRLGGMAVMGSFLISFFLTASADLIFDLRYFLAGMVMLFFIGLWDDLLPVKPIVKLAGQILPIALLFWSAPLPISSLFQSFHSGPWIDWPLTLLLGFWVINSFNLIDGINGLAGSVGMITLAGAAYLMPEASVMCLAMAGALFAFLFFNVYRPSIFLGDCGSLLIGYCMVYLVGHSLQRSPVLHSSESVVLLALMAVPLFDMVRVFIIRIFHRKNPFRGDRNHLHHLLLETGLSHLKATIILSLLGIANAGVIWALAPISLPPAIKIPAVGLIPLLFTSILWTRVREIRKIKSRGI